MRPSHPRTSIRQQNEYDSYECYDDHTLYDDEGRMQCGGNFHFVIGYTSKYGAVVFGLILRPTETEGEFRRVGSFMYPYGKELKRTKPARFDVFPDFADFVPECCERRIVMIV